MRVSLTTPTDATRVEPARPVAPTTTVTARRAQPAPVATAPTTASSGFGLLPAPTPAQPVAATVAHARNLVQIQQWAQDSGQADTNIQRQALRAYPSLVGAVQVIAPGVPLPALIGPRRIDVSA